VVVEGSVVGGVGVVDVVPLVVVVVVVCCVVDVVEAGVVDLGFGGAREDAVGACVVVEGIVVGGGGAEKIHAIQMINCFVYVYTETCIHL
jgi:hypothetical protein